MAATAPRAPRVFVYGSCVARDTVATAPDDAIDLRGYVARQSLLSVGSDASPHLPPSTGLDSPFQDRMVRADFAGSLLGQLADEAESLDLLLWDIADERHGVHRFRDGTYATRSIDVMRSDAMSEALDDSEHLPFGDDRHFELWRDRASRFRDEVAALSLERRTVALAVPWALRSVEGKPTPWSMGVRAADANRDYARYYDAVAALGFDVIALSDDVRADDRHRWGIAPFHYASDVYEQILRELARRDGLEGLAGPNAPR